MSDGKQNKLELWLVEKLKRIDPTARQTKNSGGSTELGDIRNEFLYVEAKEKHTKENIIMDYKKEWNHSIHELPVNNLKPVVMLKENK